MNIREKEYSEKEKELEMLNRRHEQLKQKYDEQNKENK